MVSAPRLRSALVTALVLVGGCVDGDSKTAAGFLTAADGPFGPSIVFDPEALPIPEVPFPSDLVLTGSDDNDVGTVWNISTQAPTAVERAVRANLNTLDGFGVYTPISVAFDAPISLDSVNTDTVRLVNIEAGHPREGEQVALDFGDGFFPMDGQGSYWPFDPSANLPDFVMPRHNDYLYRGRVQRVLHYEVDTHTVLVRPIDPLDPGVTYAVLLTEGIVGEGTDDDGHFALLPIRSPFPFKAHAAQTSLVKRALDLTDVTPDTLAFGWTFTTSDPIRPFERLRAGLYGEGPMKRLAERFPPTLGEIRDTDVAHDADGVEFPADPQDNRFILQSEFLASVLGIVAGLASEFSISMSHVDYVAFGSLETPNIRTGPGGVQGVNTDTGEGDFGTESVPYLVAVPKTTDAHAPPFPVVFYFHGTATSRFEFLALADNLARQGIATIAFDQVGHGPLIPDIRVLLAENDLDPGLAAIVLPVLAELLVPGRKDEFDGLGFEEGLDKLSEIGFFAELAVIGRTEDANGDGALESSESFFYANPFKQCASITQNLLDFMQFVRVVRSFDPAAIPPGIDDVASASTDRIYQNVIAGDFNADGVLDIGGPDVPIGVAGTSLGGLHAVMSGVVEPEVSTITPIVAGGGLTDILLRSKLRQITRVIYLEVLGPLIIGCPDGSGGLWLSFNNQSDKCGADLSAVSFAHVPDIGAGAWLRLGNLSNGEAKTHALSADGEGFAVAIEADRWDQLHIQLNRPDQSRADIYVRTPYEGLALERNTPDLRRFLGINQHVLGRCDPISFARHVFLDPREGHQPKSILFANALKDKTVPISTGVNLARATGALGRDREAWGPIMDVLIARGVMTASDYDPDDLTNDNPPDEPGIGPLVPVPSGSGVSSIRFANVRGKHEWIAGVSSDLPIDAAVYTRNQLVLFHKTGGAEVVDDLCIQDNACELLEPE